MERIDGYNINKKPIIQNEPRDYWKEVMSKRNNDDMSRGVMNKLTRADADTIFATAEFFGANDNDLHQMAFDLLFARYRIFDWLAMGVMSANDNPRIPVNALQVFVYSFLKVDGVVSEFIKDLRETDYDLDNSWTIIDLKGGDIK